MAGQDVQGMLIRIEATTAQLRQEMDKADASVTKATGRIDDQLGKVDSAFDRVGKSAESAANILKGALAIAIGGAGVGALVAQAEAYTQVANRLKLVTSNSQEFTAAQNAVFSIAQKSGQPLGATAELYQRIAQNQDALKLSGKGVAGIVETISKTMVISGASSESANAALIQLGQAFASGTLRGEELNSVMEQAPALSQAIAKGMGVSVGALRALGAEGKLTAESVVKALQAQQGAVDALFGKMQSTIGMALTRIQTSFTKIIGEADAFNGTSASLADSLNSVSKALSAINVPAAMAVLEEHGRALTEIFGVVLIAALGRVAAGLVDAGVKAAGNVVTWVQLTAVTQAAAAAKIEETVASAALAAAHVAEASTNVEVARATEVGMVAKLGLLQAQRDQLGYTAALAVGTAEEVLYTKALAATDVELAVAKRAAYASSVQLGTALNVESAAMAKDATATEAATLAKAEYAAISSTAGRAGGALLGVLGGPVGLGITVVALAASYLMLGSNTDAATKALIDQNATVDQAIQKFNDLDASQQRLQTTKWVGAQRDALKSAATDLGDYAAKTYESLNLVNRGSTEYQEQFARMLAEVRDGKRTLDTVTAWAQDTVKLTPMQVQRLTELSAAYDASTKQAGNYGEILGRTSKATTGLTANTQQLNAIQKGSGQSDASLAAWAKYIEQLTKTRDLLGANAAAEAAYTAAKMGATPQQMAQAKLIADETDTLKKYQEAIKESNTVEQAALKLKLVGLYAAEDATSQTAATQKAALDDAAKASESSATRQVAAMQRIIDQTVRVATGTDMPRQNLSGYGLLTNGGTAPAAPVVPVAPKATPDQRATAAIAQLDATTEANKRVDKAANAAATALKNQEKALTDLLDKSGISTKSANEMADAYLGGASNVRALTIQQKIEEELLKTGASARDKVTKAINDEQDAKDREDVTKNIAQMRDEITQTLAQATATLGGKDALEAFNIQKSMAVALSGKNIEYGSKEYEQLLATTKAQLDANKALDQAGQVEGIVDRLIPQTKMLKDYTAEQDALNAAISRYPENAALYQDALVKLGNEYEVNRRKATLWGQMTEGAIDRIDEAFATAWGSIGSGAESLWDNLKKGFQQTLGEIAHMLTTKPLLASISNWLTGTDNGQGLSSVWSKLLGTVGSSSGSSSSSSMGSMISLGKNLYSAYSAITGVGSSIASGYAAGGVSGAVSGGVGYYSTMLSNLGTTLSSGFSSLVSSITGTAATQTAATIGAQGVTSAALSGAVTEGAAAIGTQFSTGVATTTAATYAAAEAGATATAASIGGQISAAMSSAAAMWPLAVIMGMYQSGKLYSAGVRPDGGAIRDAAGSTTLGKVAMAPGAAMADIWKVTDNALAKVVGGKWAAILSGSTFSQAVTTKVAETLFGTGYQTKDSGIQMGVTGGEFDAQQFIKQKKKGGWLSGSSKTRYLTGELDSGTKDALGSQYNDTVMSAMALFDKLNVTLNSSVLDGLNMAVTRISTQDKTAEVIQTEVDAWFTKLGNSAVLAISDATGADTRGFTFDTLTTFVNNLYSVNDVFKHVSISAYDMSVSGGFMAEQLSLWAGGLDALKTSFATYYGSFFTDAEKATNTLSDVQGAFSALSIALPDSRDGFRDMVSGIDKTTESGRQMLLTLLGMSETASAAYDILEARQSTYYSTFYSESENAARSLDGFNQVLKDAGVSLPPLRAGFRDLVEAASKDTTAAGKKMYDTLMSLAGTAGSAYDILETKAKSAAETLKTTLADNITSAMSAVQRAVTGEKNALTEAYNARVTSLNDMATTAQQGVTDMTAVSSSLENALKSLNGTSDDAVKMLRAQAQATLQSALATARSGGSLSGITGLDDALSTVSTNTTDLYSSLEDFNREQGRTANVVAELNAINGVQLTTEQQLLKTVQDQIKDAKGQFDAQMEGLDAQLSLAQAQVDKLNGIDTSVLSVKDAIAGLGAALSAAMAAAKPSAAVGGSYTGTAGAPSASDLNSIYNSVLGRDADPTGAAYWAGQLGSGAITPGGLASAIKNDAIANGEIQAHAMGGLISGPGTGTSDSILSRLSNGEYVMRAAAVNTYGTGLLDQMNSLQLPAYADGGGVGESGPQLEVTGPSRIYNAKQAASMLNGGDSGATVAELRQLRQEVKDNSTAFWKLLEKMSSNVGQIKEGGLQINGTVQTKVATA